MAMPVGHACIGLAFYQVARSMQPQQKLPWSYALLFVALSGLPDLDCVPIWLFNSPHEWIHRTGMHSLSFALITGVGLALFFQNGLKQPYRHFYWLFPITIASHGVVDLLHTDFNTPCGVQYFWPFSTAFLYLPQPFLLSMAYFKILGATTLQACAVVLGREALMFGLGLNAGMFGLLQQWHRLKQACSR